MITPVILLITNDVPKDMGRSPRTLIASMLVVLMLLSGCTSPDVDQPVLIGEELEGVENPCSQPTEPLAQSNTILNVGGVDRMFRLSIPSSDAGTEPPILLAFHGEDMAEEEFHNRHPSMRLARSMVSSWPTLYPSKGEQRPRAIGS